MIPPIKPFDTYKWRWLSVQPSEGLLAAPVFLGVLRVLRNNEGESYSSELLLQELQVVEEETGTNIELARNPQRNLFRNSGQYWRGTGLVTSRRGIIELTPLGIMVADGQLTKDEFVTLIIRNTVLPNHLTYKEAEVRKWENVNLRIKPFELILAIMLGLGRRVDILEAYMTPNELIKVVIPLAGVKESVDTIISALVSYRMGALDIAGFPDCAPKANDKRLAREFLLFLRNFGVCLSSEETDSRNLYEEKFRVDDVSLDLVSDYERPSFFEEGSLVNEELSALRESEIPVIIERQRRLVSVAARSGQGRFRREVIQASNRRCIFTQESIEDVIEAAHIIPVAYHGTDGVDNGLCMRVDIHKLFDKGKIRISHDGAVFLNREVADSVTYRNLPRNISFPPSVNISNVEWRWRYL